MLCFRTIFIRRSGLSQPKATSDFKASQSLRATSVSVVLALFSLLFTAPFHDAMATGDSPSFLASATEATTPLPAAFPPLWIQTAQGPQKLQQILATRGHEGKPVFVLFWAPFCKICVDELPEVAALTEAATSPFTLIPIAVQSQGAALLPLFLKRHNVTLPLLWVETMDDLRLLPLRGLPTGFWADSKGRLQSRADGARAWQSPPPQQPLGRGSR